MRPEDIVAQGNPVSTSCRWCRTPKRAHRGALICTTCDGPIHLLVTKPRRTEDPS